MRPSRTVAFTLSESLCIGDRREGVLGMIEAGLVDILFGNEHEIRHLTGCGRPVRLRRALLDKVGTLVITRGADGALGFENGETRRRSRLRRSRRIVDTTGAGDLFAAGFLAARAAAIVRSRAASRRAHSLRQRSSRISAPARSRP